MATITYIGLPALVARGMDALEMPGQRLRRLAVAGAAIPGQIAAGASLREPGEQLGRIGRPGFRVVGGVAREVVGSHCDPCPA